MKHSYLCVRLMCTKFTSVFISHTSYILGAQKSRFSETVHFKDPQHVLWFGKKKGNFASICVSG